MNSNYLALLRFELNYQLKSWAVPFFTLGYFGFAFLMGSQGATPARVNYNADYELFFKMGLLSLGSVFSIIFFVVTAIQRDRKYAMEPLVYCTPVSKSAFYFSRFTGAWVMGITVLLLAIPGFYLGICLSGLDPERIGQFTVMSPFSLAWMLLIPSVTICTALIFTVCLHSRNTMATYAMAILIYGAYFICAIFLNSPLIANAAPVSSENLFIAALADPFGLSAFFEQANLWTPYQKNTRPISFTGLLAWNRMLWFIGTAFLLGISYWKFSFRQHPNTSPRKIKRLEPPLPTVPVLKNLTPSIGGYSQVIPSSIRLELSQVFKSLPFWVVTGSWIVIAVTEIYSKIYSGGAYGERYFPASQILLEQVQPPLYLFSLVLVVFFTGELVWRAKESNFHEIIGATPAPGGYFLISTFTSLMAMTGVMICVTLGICFGYQLVQGYQGIDSLPLLVLVLSPGIPLLFFTLLMLQIHQWCRNKYLGMCLSALAIALFAGPLGTALGINHPLLKIGTAPFLTYSQQAGFGLASKSFWLLNLLWMILGLIISINLFSNWKGSLVRKSQKSGWATYSKMAFPALLLFTVGGFYLYHINMVGNYTSVSTRLDEQHQYELNYKKYEADPLLTYSSLAMEVDLFPSKSTFNAVVSGHLKNISEKPIHRLLLTEKVELAKLSIEKASPIAKDEKLRVNLIEFETPIQAGEEIAFSFEVNLKAALFRQERSIVTNGSYVKFRDFVPYFGYSEDREISDNQERKKRNLPLKSLKSTYADHPELERNLVKVDFKAKVSTESPQVVITSGELKAVLHSGDRTSFEFESANKIMPAIAFFSGNYHVDSIQSHGVNLQVYSIPEHRETDNHTLGFMGKTLEFATSNFGTYPLDHLQIVEVPSYWEFGGYAHPGVISMVEDNYFQVKSVPGEPFDLKAKRTIHEVAHQWFGHMLAPRNIPGASILVEGLAKYTEALVMEREFGKAALWHLTDNANRTYFSGRANASEPEPPLAFTEDQSYLAYGKSLLSLLALRDLVGEEKLNEAIKETVARSMEHPEPTATMDEFLNRVKSNAASAHIKGITEAFEKVIHFDLKINEAHIEQLENGKYQMTVTYAAKKLETLADGSEIEIPMKDEIMLSAFSTHPKDLSTPDGILYSQNIVIQEGSVTSSILLDQKPSFIALDPWGTKPDANRADNMLRVQD